MADKILSNYDPNNVKYYKQDINKVTEQKIVKNETTIDDGNGNPLFNVIDHDRGNASIQETLQEWISYINPNNNKK